MSKNAIVGIVIVIIVVVGGFLYFKSTMNQSADYTNTVPVERNEGAGGTGSSSFTSTTTSTTTTTIVVPVNVTVPSPKTITITYSDQGFGPAVVTINKGDTVKFINQSSGRMWVASNPHPTHTDYPEFDEKSFAQNGGSYEFTFGKVGTWDYHNHGNPGDKGTIIVK